MRGALALFRGRMLSMLLEGARRPASSPSSASTLRLADGKAFTAFLEPLWQGRLGGLRQEPFAGPRQVLAYLSRYTHRVAISNSRLIAADASAASPSNTRTTASRGPDRYKTMTLEPGEFIRRFLLHVLPKGFHRIRHYGLLASGTKAKTIARARKLIATATPMQPTQQKPGADSSTAPDKPAHPCPCCGCRMVIIETFEAGHTPRHQPTVPVLMIRVDTS